MRVGLPYTPKSKNFDCCDVIGPMHLMTVKFRPGDCTGRRGKENVARK